MVVRRPKRPGDEPPAPEGQDVKLMEHLVKKSLEVNPTLRGEEQDDTQRVLQNLREEAMARSQGGTGTQPSGGRGQPQRSTSGKPATRPAAGAARGGAGGSNSDLSERRRNTIAFFFEQKRAEFEELVVGIDERERALRAERQVLQTRFAEELGDFLNLLGQGAKGPEAKDVMREFRDFLQALDVHPEDLAGG